MSNKMTHLTAVNNSCFSVLNFNPITHSLVSTRVGFFEQSWLGSKRSKKPTLLVRKSPAVLLQWWRARMGEQPSNQPSSWDWRQTSWGWVRRAGVPSTPGWKRPGSSCPGCPGSCSDQDRGSGSQSPPGRDRPKRWWWRLGWWKLRVQQWSEKRKGRKSD